MISKIRQILIEEVRGMQSPTNQYVVINLVDNTYVQNIIKDTQDHLQEYTFNKFFCLLYRKNISLI